MQKVIITLILFIVILSTSIVGYNLVKANKKITEIKDIISYQESKKDYLHPYNYTIDNPNIKINPYGISPLTALITFTTEKEEEVTVTIVGKDNNSTYKNTFKKTSIHYIPIIGLYANYENKIIIECGQEKKEYTIKTEPLPNNIKIKNKENNTNQVIFIKEKEYIYAIDNNNEVRWYIEDKNNNKISRLQNGHFLISNKTKIDKEYSLGLLEIDLLGKVYKEYDIDSKYYGSYAEKDNSLLILSDNIIEIEKNTGKIIKTIKLKEKYQSISYKNDIIILKNNNKIKEINYNTNKEKKYETTNIIMEDEIILPLYNIDTYKIEKGIKFINQEKTKVAKKKIMLLNYKKTDKKYKKYKIKLLKESDRLIVDGQFKENEKAYIILDKFLDKKVYNIHKGLNYVNKEGLNGNYSIYIKINNNIYKTDNYVIF